MYKLILHKKVIKFLQKRVPKEKDNIDSKFRLLIQNPYINNKNLDIKKLKNTEFYRLRINDYRFIYEIIENELVLLMVNANNRGDVY